MLFLLYARGYLIYNDCALLALRRSPQKRPRFIDDEQQQYSESPSNIKEPDSSPKVSNIVPAKDFFGLENAEGPKLDKSIVLDPIHEVR